MLLTINELDNQRHFDTFERVVTLFRLCNNRRKLVNNSKSGDHASTGFSVEELIGLTLPREHLSGTVVKF